MYVPEIVEVKQQLDAIKSQGLVAAWELPYENLLTRRSAALFFVTPADENNANAVWNELEKYDNFSVRPNREQTLSKLKYRISFSKEEKEKNMANEPQALSNA